MRQRAVVVETEGNIAIIEVSRSTMCEGCEKNGGCGGHCHITGLVASGNKMKTRAYNKIHARVGDKVEVETASGRVLGYAALVFLLPLLTCALFYYLANIFFHSIEVAAVAAVFAFIVTFVLIAVIDRKAAKRTPDIAIVARLED